MKTIRHNIFESNSSSSHSISFQPQPISTRSHIDIDCGVLCVQRNDFGWGPESYSDAYNKISYWVTKFMPMGSLSLPEYQTLLTAIKLERPDIYSIDISGVGYIDHQSEDMEVPHEDINMIREFIFNPDFVLIIDNDN